MSGLIWNASKRLVTAAVTAALAFGVGYALEVAAWNHLISIDPDWIPAGVVAVIAFLVVLFREAEPWRDDL